MPATEYINVTEEDIRALSETLAHFSRRYSEMADSVEGEVSVPNWKTAKRAVKYLQEAVNRMQAAVEKSLVSRLDRPINDASSPMKAAGQHDVDKTIAEMKAAVKRAKASKKKRTRKS